MCDVYIMFAWFSLYMWTTHYISIFHLLLSELDTEKVLKTMLTYLYLDCVSEHKNVKEKNQSRFYTD